MNDEGKVRMKREMPNAKRETIAARRSAGHGSRITNHGSRLTVCVVTGTRAEFGIWTLLLQMIQHWPWLELRLVVTGTHLLRDFGSTVRDIERQGYLIAAKVPMYRPGEPAAKSLSRGIAGLAAAYRKVGR